MSELKVAPLSPHIIQLIPDAPLPSEACVHNWDWLPRRALKYCQPVIDASNTGYYVYPPFDFDLINEGRRLIVHHKSRNGTVDEIFEISDQYLPGFIADQFREGLDASAEVTLPAIFTKFPEPGLFQFWTGLLCRTPPGVGTLIRPIVNRSQETTHRILEGFIETDWWKGPLISNIEITSFGVVIPFRRNNPMLQVQFLAYAGRSLNNKTSNNNGPRLSMAHERTEFLRFCSSFSPTPSYVKRSRTNEKVRDALLFDSPIRKMDSKSS